MRLLRLLPPPLPSSCPSAASSITTTARSSSTAPTLAAAAPAIAAALAALAAATLATELCSAMWRHVAEDCHLWSLLATALLFTPRTN